MTSLPVYQIDPLEDSRWEPFVQAHPRGSVFHSPEWLRPLQRTYGYEPVALTTSAPGEVLTNGIVFCRIKSWLTGRRLVSLPFSDHCEPLGQSDEQLESLLAALERDRDSSKGKYLEIRPIGLPDNPRPYLEKGETFCFHRLDLRPSSEELFKGFHKDCVQRKIRRAQREGLTYEDGRSEILLNKFYPLLALTRRRFRLPPQPLIWFHNLIESMGDKLQILVASKDGHPIASILTLRYKGTLTYKYGCLDRAFSNLGGMQMLLWKAIEEAKLERLSELDMGRCELSNQGLIEFKRRWGVVEFESAYLRAPVGQGQSNPAEAAVMRAASQVVAVAPLRLVIGVAKGLYRHFG